MHHFRHICRPLAAIFAIAILHVFALPSRAASDVKVSFTLHTTNLAGSPIVQNRTYFVYRPDDLPKARPVPMILCFNGRPATFFHRKADQAGFVLVSCVILGHTTPKQNGPEDLDYTSAVIDAVARDENCNDAFVCGLSMGGHMACAYACERPQKIKAAADADEFMGLASNIPSAPVPMIFFEGTKDDAVPYAMVKDTVDAWRKTNSLFNTAPITTFENAPRTPGKVTQATWPGTNPIAFVTVGGGSHTWPTPDIQSGFDITDAMWSFFAQFLTPASHGPRITADPLDNIQYIGHPASYRVAAVGDPPLQYQWQKNGQDIPGARASFYTTPPTTKEDSAAVFSVVVTGSMQSVTSRPAKLTLLPPKGPTLQSQPANQSVIAGQPVTFTAAVASASGLHFKWQKNAVDIPGANEASYTIPAAITADCGATFRLIAADSTGTTTSIPATLAVIPAAARPTIVANPTRARIHPGETAAFSVSAQSATPMTYQWQKARVTTNYANIPGANAAVFTTPPAILADQHTLFRCIVTNSAGNAASAAEMLMVTAPPPATAPTKLKWGVPPTAFICR